MSQAVSGPPAAASVLHRRALSLGAVNAVSYAVQFLLPVVLAHFLLPEAFGEYRLIWLVIMTAMSFVPMEMSGVLFYFLPRTDPAARAIHVRQTWLYLAGAGSLAAWATSPLNPWLPVSVRALSDASGLLPVLVLAYASTMLLDTLPTIEERVRWQAAATLSLSVLRALLLSAAAWFTGDLRLMLWLILLTFLVKGVLLLTYIARQHGLRGRWFESRRFSEQLRHALPFGIADMLFQLRGQAGQWVAASLFPLGHFAAFSIATMVGPLVGLCRQSVNHVYLPSMSRLHAADDMRGMVRLNCQANAMVAMVAYPVLAFVFIFAEDLLSLVFPAAYLIAAPVMRIIIAGLLIQLVELSSLTLLYRDGRFVLRINALLAVVSAASSWLGAQHFGLAGAALGGTAALLIDRGLTLRRIAEHTGLPFGQLQDWQKLARLLVAVGMAGLTAWQTDRLLPGDGWPLGRLLFSGSVLLVTYGLLLHRNGDLPRWPAKGLAQTAPGNSLRAAFSRPGRPTRTRQ